MHRRTMASRAGSTFTSGARSCIGGYGSRTWAIAMAMGFFDQYGNRPHNAR